MEELAQPVVAAIRGYSLCAKSLTAMCQVVKHPLGTGASVNDFKTRPTHVKELPIW